MSREIRIYTGVPGDKVPDDHLTLVIREEQELDELCEQIKDFLRQDFDECNSEEDEDAR